MPAAALELVRPRVGNLYRSLSADPAFLLPRVIILFPPQSEGMNTLSTHIYHSRVFIPNVLVI